MQSESQAATKHDVLALRQDLNALRAEMATQGNELRREISRVTREMYMTASVQLIVTVFFFLAFLIATG